MPGPLLGTVPSSVPWRAIIRTGYGCNNRCLFCHTSGTGGPAFLPAAEVLARIDEAVRIGADQVLFSGGEPTIRKDLLELADGCRRRGLRFGLITNGRMLSYRPLLARLADLGLAFVNLSLHGPAQVHDSLTRVPGSHVQALAACRLLQQLPEVETVVNAVVTIRNLEGLSELVELLAPLDRLKLRFTLVEPKGAARSDDSLIPPPTMASAAVSRAIARGEALGCRPSRFGIDGFPHCLLPSHARLQDDMYTTGVRAIREVEEERFHPIDYANMAKPAPCRGCLLGDDCRGSWRLLFDQFGHEWLAPRYGGRGNSCDFFPVSARQAATLSPERVVRVRLKGRVRLFATDTGDFDGTLQEGIRQQLYLQRDEAPLVTDFAAQLRRLVPGRGGIYIEAPGDLFAQAEGQVHEALATLAGAVLDVGCGHNRYLPQLLPMLAGGRISYTGIDPVPGSELLMLAGQGMLGIHAQAVEQAPLAAAQADWVLVLRSHNHLADLWTAYRRLLGALKWGGHLLVVDNVPFGLVRPAFTRARLERVAMVPPEHLRNHSHEEAAAFLGRFPLQLLRRIPVGPTTANQWLLLYRKAWPSGELGADSFLAPDQSSS